MDTLPEASLLNSQLSDRFFVHLLYTDVIYHRTHYRLEVQNWR